MLRLSFLSFSLHRFSEGVRSISAYRETDFARSTGDGIFHSFLIDEGWNIMYNSAQANIKIQIFIK